MRTLGVARLATAVALSLALAAPPARACKNVIEEARSEEPAWGVPTVRRVALGASVLFVAGFVLRRLGAAARSRA